MDGWMAWLGLAGWPFHTPCYMSLAAIQSNSSPVLSQIRQAPCEEGERLTSITSSSLWTTNTQVLQNKPSYIFTPRNLSDNLSEIRVGVQIKI